MKSKSGIAALIIAILALCLSIANMGMSQKPAQQEAT